MFSLSTLVVHIEGKVLAADEDGEGYRVYFSCSTGEPLLKSLNYCYLLIILVRCSVVRHL